MPTDHACQAAADAAARSLRRLRDHLGEIQGHDGALRPDHSGPADGAAGLLVFLDGLHAQLSDTLIGWHSTVGLRVCDVLGLPPPGPGSTAPRTTRQLFGWDALSLVRHRAEEILTTMADRSHDGPVGGAALPRRLDLVGDALAGALRRLGVPVPESAHHAAELAAATGSIFGMHPHPRTRVPHPMPAPAHPQPPATPFVHLPQMSDWAKDGMP
ncbi:hypothetical protein [Streptomyces sp. NPDC057877]|uniref:hypothetical protein n=1 Tax=Streptomyces sp. NPDC057877 TaxID=3346269 RepID=UPI0036865AFE